MRHETPTTDGTLATDCRETPEVKARMGHRSGWRAAVAANRDLFDRREAGAVVTRGKGVARWVVLEWWWSFDPADDTACWQGDSQLMARVKRQGGRQVRNIAADELVPVDNFS